MSDKKTPVCGIIMPISASDDIHTEAHWAGVKSMLTRAIELAECHPQPVWEKGGNDIIQASILKNLFENEIAVVDISTRNPNVMLEWGMRLTTKKPTIVVAEQGTQLPFDTGIIHTEFYNRSQQWASAEAFIENVADLIRSMLKAKDDGSYKPYLESFQFETVEPRTVSITSEERMESLIGQVIARLTRIERRLPEPVGKNATAGLERPERWTERREGTESISAAGVATEADVIREFGGLAGSYSPGDKVLHAKFGEGTVLEVEGNKILTDFQSHGPRRIISSFVKPA